MAVYIQYIQLMYCCQLLQQENTVFLLGCFMVYCETAIDRRSEYKHEMGQKEPTGPLYE
jgi:hypothetical protein